MLAVTIITPILTALIITIVFKVAEKDNEKEFVKYDEQYFVMQASRSIMKFVKPLCYILNVTISLLFGIGIWQEPMVAAFTPLVVVGLYLYTKLMIGCSKFGLVVKGDVIVYRGIWKSKKKIFTFQEIDYFVEKTTQIYGKNIINLYAYSKDNKKMFVVGGTLSCFEYFLRAITAHSIEIRKKKI